MVTILGVSCYYHDAAAALVRDGNVVAAAGEERFCRRKHANDFPEGAIAYCLQAGGIQGRDLDAVVFYEKPIRKFDRLLIQTLCGWPLTYRLALQALPIWLRSRLHIRGTLRRHLDFRGDILFAEHHLAHAAAAFLPSPFEEAAILTADGVGEWTSTAAGTGIGTDILLDREIPFPHSLGLFYSALTAYLGFRVNDAEWKVMGLAPYGEPRFVDAFRRMIVTRRDGSFRLDMRYFQHHRSVHRMTTRAYEDLLGRPARRPEEELDTFHQDVARSGQQVVEEALLGLARAIHERTGKKDLCIAGGVGLNSVANWRILRETPFERIFIQPAAGDDGGALGAALFAYHTLLGNPRRWVMDHAFLGPAFSDAEIRAFLEERHADFEPLDHGELLRRTADLLARNRVVGWFQGRMEFGPRSLGHRSILANPADPEMKSILNRKIKFREPFRPFAPSVLLEAAPEYFDMEEGMESPFMLLVPRVRPEQRDRIPAVTHHDGTGRVQTVRRDVDPLFYDLLSAFRDRTGLPVLLNTSFNVRGEPIVCTPAEAYSGFLRTGMDDLVLGSFLVRKPGGAELSEAEGRQASEELEREM